MQRIKINNFEEELIYEKLPSGLGIYLFPNKKIKGFMGMFMTNYGASDVKFKINDKETVVPTGIAHFLEHKLFERENNPFEFYSKYGVDVNAFTTKDITVYHFTGNNNFNKALKYLVEWVPTFTTDDEKVKKEQGIILEEASMYKDMPEAVLEDKMSENIFLNHTYKYKTIGTDQDIQSITKEQLYLCYNAFYRPDNMNVVVVGNFDYKDALKIIKESLSDFNSKYEKVEKENYSEPDEVVKAYEEIYMDVEVPKISMMVKIPKSNFKDLNIDKYNLDYYINLYLSLTFGSTTEFKEDMFKKQMFSSFIYNKSDTYEHYLLEINADSIKPKELLKEIKKQFKDAKYSIDNFERIKKIWISSEVRMIDDISAVAFSALDDIIEYNEFKPNKINDIKNLSFEEFLRVKDCINFDNVAEIIIFPKK